jgi:outer membrane lipoprotein-sorting protein
MSIFLTITLALLGLLPGAQEQTAVDEILAKVEKAGEDLRSFSADIELRELDEFGDTNSKQGKMHFLAPGRYLLITYFEGKAQEELGTNEDDAWRIRHHVKTVDHMAVDSDAEISDGYSFSDADDLREKFDLKVAGEVELEAGPAWHLIAIPKEESSLKSLEIWILKESPLPFAKLKAVKKRIQETMIFTNIKRNIDLDSDLFRFEAPSGYQLHER